MIWIKKAFGFGAEWAADQDKFSQLQMAVAAQGGDKYLQMVMALAEKSDLKETIYMGLPEEGLIATFPDYQRVSDRLPKIAILLVGLQTEFQKHFDFPPVT